MTELDRILDKVIRKCPAGSSSILSLREVAEITCGIVGDETAALRAEVKALRGALRLVYLLSKPTLTDEEWKAVDPLLPQDREVYVPDEIIEAIHDQARAALAQTQEVE
jgi:hypothetical protein